MLTESRFLLDLCRILMKEINASNFDLTVSEIGHLNQERWLGGFGSASPWR